MCTAFSPVVEVKKDDPAQCDCGEQGQGLVWIEIERDHGTDHPVQPGDGDEQAYGGDHRQRHEEHGFSSYSKALKGKERPEVGIRSVLLWALWMGPRKAKLSVS